MEKDLLPINTSLNMAQELVAIDIGRDYTMATGNMRSSRTRSKSFKRTFQILWMAASSLRHLDN